MREEVIPGRMLFGFFAGFIAVLVFQQPVLALLYALHFAPGPAYSYAMTMPLGVPYVWSLAFWGGVWGVVLGAVDHLFPPDHFWRTAAIYGAVVPTLFEWILVLAIVHRPFGGTWTVGAIVTPFVMNAAWGLGAEAIVSGMSLGWRMNAD